GGAAGETCRETLLRKISEPAAHVAGFGLHLEGFGPPSLPKGGCRCGWHRKGLADPTCIPAEVCSICRYAEARFPAPGRPPKPRRNGPASPLSRNGRALRQSDDAPDRKVRRREVRVGHEHRPDAGGKARGE